MNDYRHVLDRRSIVAPSANRCLRYSFTACHIVYVLAIALLSTIPCKADYGPLRDVKAARQAELAAWGEIRNDNKCYERSKPWNKCGIGITDVTVVDRYAIVDWSAGEGGGQSLLRRDGKRWRRIGHGGGVMGLGIVEAFGVPHSIAVKLVAHNAASNTAEHFMAPRAAPQNPGDPIAK